MSVHQTGNSESSKRNKVLQRSSFSSAVLGDMVKQPSLLFEAFISVSCVPDVHLFRPRVKSPCGAEQATLWLRRDGEEPKTDLISVSRQQVSCMRIEAADFEAQCVLRSADVRKEGGTKPPLLCQQAVLQLLVMNQEQEREQLLCLLRGASLEDLQDLDRDSLMKEGKIISPFLLNVTCSFSHRCYRL